jgi:hypothetical protein
MRTISQVAEELGLTTSTVRRKCITWDIKMEKEPRVDRNGAVQEMLVISDADAARITTYYEKARKASEEAAKLAPALEQAAKRRAAEPRTRGSLLAARDMADALTGKRAKKAKEGEG